MRAEAYLRVARPKLGLESKCRKYLEKAFEENRKYILADENWEWELKRSKRGQTRRYAGETGNAWVEWTLNLVNKETRTKR